MLSKQYTKSPLFQLELLLFTHNENQLKNELENSTPTTKPILENIQHFINAEYFEIITSNYAKKFFENPKKISLIIEEYLHNINENDVEFEVFSITLIGIATLSIFSQLNWTGPKLSNQQQIQFIQTLVNNFETKEILENIQEEGCDGIYQSAIDLPLLIIARDILTFPFPVKDDLFSTKWFSSRCLILQQSMFKDKSEILKIKIIRNFDPVTQFLEKNKNEIPSEILAMNYIERGYEKHIYKEVSNAREFFNKAKQSTGVKMELTGALGRKTKFQTFDTSQLILKVESFHPVDHIKNNNNNNNNNEENIINAPVQIDTDDTIVLQKTSYKDQEHNDKSDHLSFIDQLIIVTQVYDNKNFHPSEDPMTVEENLAYLQRLGEEKGNWLIFSMYLYLKALIESRKFKTSERAVLQIQSLVDQYDDEDPSVKERMRYFYSLYYPARHQMKIELGKQYLRLGVAASAREIFIELKQWPELIHSYVILNDISMAEKIVRERLEEEETAELWCILGEVLNEDEYYIKSWEFSNHKFAKSQRLLARSLLNQKKFDEAIDSFRLCLTINPIHPHAWFSMGCACLNTQRWSEASLAFSRVVQLEPSKLLIKGIKDGESWSNLGVSYLKLQKLEEAHSAFQEGVKHNYDSWKMWENLLLVCCRLGYIFQAIQSLHRLFDLRGNQTDFSVISSIVDCIVKQLRNNDCNKQLLEQVKELLGRASSIVATNPELWRSYGDLEEALGNTGKALDYRMKLIRQVQVVDWQTNKEDFIKVASAELEYLNTVKLLPNKKNLHSARLHLRGVLQKSKEYFENTEEFAKLNNALDEISELEKEANN